MAYSTISKPNLYFNTKLYTGNGSTQSITGVGFQPDFTWIKNRNTNHDHILTDAVRGVTKDIRSNNTDTEATDSNGLTTFGTDGFTVGTKANINNNGNNIVSWNWKANGAGSSNTDGTINTTATSANTTAGFSISTYTGTGSAATVGHGLGVLPSMIIIKSRSKSGQNWITWHKAFTGNNEYVELNTTDAKDTYDMIDNTSNTTSVFAISGDGNVNESGATYVAYCFAEKTGYSKFGSFVGNGQAFPNSPFIYLGFKPKFFMWKNTSDGGSDDNWNIIDSTAQQYNIQDAGYLQANESGYNYSGNTINFLSNGVKLDVASAYHNQSGSTYIYMAIAEEPLVANVGASIPATAR
jgi:hypothetical protein